MSKYVTCPECQGECHVDDMDSDEGICDICKRMKEAEEEAAKSLVYELKLEGMSIDLAYKIVAAISDEKINKVVLDYRVE